MTRGNPANPTSHNGDETPPPELFDDPSLEALQDILFSKYRKRIAELEGELDALEERLTNKDAFVAIITPALSDAIRRKIRDARGEMIEALYPVIGETVVRAVSEAIRDLTRRLDAQMRVATRPGRLLRARMGGVSGGEVILRDSLPFAVAEVFLIHRETGLLLWYASGHPEEAEDTDLISGMLTAIRDFARESFGQDKEGELDEIQYGDHRILIEAARHCYLAVVVDGIEPAGFRAKIRERVIEMDLANEPVLREYEGDPTQLVEIEGPVNSLVAEVEPAQISPVQRRLLLAFTALLLLCSLSACLVGRWGWQVLNDRPTPVVIVMQVTVEPTFTPTNTPTFTATPTSTLTPTPTATFTPTPTPTSTPTSTPTPTPTATPFNGIMIGNVWLRQLPYYASPRMGLILPEGRAVEILMAADNWYRVRWAPKDQAQVEGWVPAQWVGTVNPVPQTVGTPTTDQ